VLRFGVFFLPFAFLNDLMMKRRLLDGIKLSVGMKDKQRREVIYLTFSFASRIFSDRVRSIAAKKHEV
jgi:hypothetical protein